MKKITIPSLVLVIALLLGACGSPAALQSTAAGLVQSASESLTAQSPVPAAQKPAAQPALQATAAAPVIPGEAASLLAAYEGALTSIYDQVNPSVVNIRVLVDASAAMSGIPGFGQDPNGQPSLPFNLPGLPGNSDPNAPDQDQGQAPYGEGAGSGFVWDGQGHIVTNNHVIDNAQKIEVTFSDGSTFEAELVGTDPDSDLAVLKVDAPASYLRPVQMGDSDQLKVGQLAIAIGNPYGLEGTMTTGIISALGRTMPAGEGMTGSRYSIPDVIQTDAPINPGNSGGVLLNDAGQVIGVTFAIESASGSNAGIGFVIPAGIVQRVVPSLITDGNYKHPYLGITAGDLTPALAEAMNLDASQRGVLIGEVASGGPSDKAGLLGSSQEATVEGVTVNVGGDVVIAIDNQPVQGMDDIISYLSRHGQVGKDVTLTILRDGKQMELPVTLGERPGRSAAQAPASGFQHPQVPGTQPGQGQPNQPKSSGRAWMGISAGALTPEAAAAMGLKEAQTGVLVQAVQPGSPADEAGLLGGDEAFTVQGQEIMIGGDVITAIDGQSVASMDALVATLQNYQPGDQITLTVLRDGKTLELQLTLGERPANP